MSESTSTVVSRFLKACADRDLEGLLSMVTDDVDYDNVPIGPVHGPDGVRSALTGGIMDAADEIEWRVLRQVGEGDIVMNERVDRFRFGDRWLEIPVAGIFELRDGRIAVWHDYFDLDTYRRQKADLLATPR